ncbi:unnamed protein product, partial [marine sediment metagenome]
MPQRLYEPINPEVYQSSSHSIMTLLNRKDGSFRRYQQTRKDHWDKVARRSTHWRGWGGYYHRRLTQIYQFSIVPKQRVLEIGCGLGDLLAALDPDFGVGVDFSGEMLKLAQQRHPNLTFIQADAHELHLNQKFDFIILSDLLNDLWDVQAVL